MCNLYKTVGGTVGKGNRGTLTPWLVAWLVGVLDTTPDL